MENIIVTELEERIQYSFKNKETLKLALTHSSYANEKRLGKGGYNERLEFLGDAALELSISKYIYEKFPDMPEGELTKLRASIVCEGSLAKISRQLNLGKYLFLGKGEMHTGGRDRASVLADAFEAVAGGICVDGGFEEANKYILNNMEELIEELRDTFKDVDYKTRLQEIIQKDSKIPVQYIIVDEKGPDHGKEFTARVVHDEKVLGEGKGKSKKEAEQNAAKAAIK